MSQAFFYFPLYYQPDKSLCFYMFLWLDQASPDDLSERKLCHALSYGTNNQLHPQVLVIRNGVLVLPGVVLL